MRSLMRIGKFRIGDSVLPLRTRQIEKELAAAIRDLLHENYFKPLGLKDPMAGPYSVAIGIRDSRLILEINDHSGLRLTTIILSLSTFRRVAHDYTIVCESHAQAVDHGETRQVEALETGRRALHDEGAELLINRLEGKILVDIDTARRLFTIIYILQVRNRV